MIIGGERKSPTKEQLLWDEKLLDPYELGKSIQSLKKRVSKQPSKFGLYVGDFSSLAPSDCVFLQLCRSHCDVFVVCIPTDYSMKLNGKSSSYSTDERVFRIGSMSCVGYICSFDEKDCSLCIDKINPDFIFYGRTRNDEEAYSSLLQTQKEKLTIVEYPWREEKVSGRFFSI